MLGGHTDLWGGGMERKLVIDDQYVGTFPGREDESVRYAFHDGEHGVGRDADDALRVLVQEDDVLVGVKKEVQNMVFAFDRIGIDILAAFQIFRVGDGEVSAEERNFHIITI